MFGLTHGPRTSRLNRAVISSKRDKETTSLSSEMDTRRELKDAIEKNNLAKVRFVIGQWPDLLR